jgi:hypothetical protein
MRICDCGPRNPCVGQLAREAPPTTFFLGSRRGKGYLQEEKGRREQARPEEDHHNARQRDQPFFVDLVNFLFNVINSIKLNYNK